MRQYWVGAVPPHHDADGTGYTGTAAIGDISPSPSIVLPANFLEKGMKLEWEAWGKYTSTGTPGTVILGVYLGTGAIASGQAITASAATTVGTSKTNAIWKIQGSGNIRTVGSGTAATILGLSDVVGIAGGTTTQDYLFAPASAPATLGFDSTIANKFMVGATPSVTTGTWTCQYLILKISN